MRIWGRIMLLEVTNLAVAYGDVRALWDISLAVNAGEIVVLIGSNGAGKTTLLRTMAGLQRPLAGGIAYEGAPCIRCRRTKSWRGASCWCPKAGGCLAGCR